VTFIKGTSGNPLGRRVEAKKHVLRELCRNDTNRVYNFLMDIIESPIASPMARIAAIKFHQETAWGKAEQSIRMNFSEEEFSGDVRTMTSEQIGLVINGKIDHLLRNLYATGALEEYIQQFKGEDGKSERVMIEVAKEVPKEELKKKLKRDMKKGKGKKDE